MTRSWLTDVSPEDDPRFVRVAQALGEQAGLANAYLLKAEVIQLVTDAEAIGQLLARRGVSNVEDIADVVAAQVRRGVVTGARDDEH